MRQVVGIAPSGSMGSGYDAAAFERCLEAAPDFIAVDAGSTDMGPYYLGAGDLFLPRVSYKRDIEIMLAAARRLGIPLIIGSAITNGTRRQQAVAAELVKEIARERGLAFRLAVIESEIDKEYLKRKAREGRVPSIGPPGDLTPEVIDEAEAIVGQMGVEPLVAALEAGAEVVVAGRACDDVLFAALPILEGFDRGLALHMGKILECAGLSAVPCDLCEPLVGILREDDFLVFPGSPDSRCTETSVACHTLYERGHPYLQPGPGGVNDLTGSTYEQVDPRTVRVSGSVFRRDDVYRVKLEGASCVGYRSACMVGVRDPIMLQELDDILGRVRERVAERFPMRRPGEYRLDFHIYGKDGVMGRLEPTPRISGHEAGILLESVAVNQDLSEAVCMFARGVLQHIHYKGILATAGNLAYPFSPFLLRAGRAYRFSVYHLLPVEDPRECFPMRLETVG